MNKKGFTLVELLAVIVLVSLLFGLGVVGISRISENMKDKAFTEKVNMIEQAGVLWGQDNKALLQSDGKCVIKEDNVSKEFTCKKITIRELIESDYLESENLNEIEYKNPEDNTSMLDNKIYVYKKNNRVTAYYPRELYKSLTEDEKQNAIIIASTDYGKTIDPSEFTNIEIDNYVYPAKIVKIETLINENYLPEEQYKGQKNEEVIIYKENDEYKVHYKDENIIVDTSCINTASDKSLYTQIICNANSKNNLIRHNAQNLPNVGINVSTEKDNYLVHLKSIEKELYYYRGNVDNNYVEFANMCFRIVKTDTKGNIRLIYSGNGKCNASDGAYIASNITHYESPIDLWYQETLLTKYSSYITFNELCIDDNFYSGQVGHLYSNTYDRLNRQVGEAFGGEVICSSPKNIANVTLLTADEVVYAGGVIGKENKYFYLNDKADFSWWLYNKSEQTVSGEDIYFVLDSNGKLSGEIGNMANQYIRPVITLRKEVEISLGDGTIDNPYIINTNKNTS